MTTVSCRQKSGENSARRECDSVHSLRRDNLSSKHVVVTYQVLPSYVYFFVVCRTCLYRQPKNLKDLQEIVLDEGRRPKALLHGKRKGDRTFLCSRRKTGFYRQ